MLLPGQDPGLIISFFPLPRDMRFLIATDAIPEMTIQIFHPTVSPAIRQILTPPPIPIILRLRSPLIVWNAIPPCQDGNQPSFPCMMLSFHLLKDMRLMNVMHAIPAVIIQIFHPIATPATRLILTIQAIPIILLPNSRPIVWNAIPPCRDGNQPISRYMMPSFSRYFRENIRVNGTTVLTAIPTRRTMLFLPVSIVMSITGTKMDDKHSGEQDYQYNSPACLECHPRGDHED